MVEPKITIEFIKENCKTVGDLQKIYKQFGMNSNYNLTKFGGKS